MKNKYKLLTPGPLTTTDSVKEQMLIDRCTWDEDYKMVTQEIRSKLLDIANVSSDEYTVVLMQGSGSFGVESIIHSALGKSDKALIITNGAYGNRIVDMAKYAGKRFISLGFGFATSPSIDDIRSILEKDNEITHVIMVHCETTTGILNPVEAVGKLAKEYGKTYIVDAMSSFGGIPMDVKDLNIDYLVSSANKCIQGVPGFSFIIVKKSELEKCKGNSLSLCLDIYDQWKGMDADGKWRYTSPTHVVSAFRQAIEELEAEGGVEARYKRYSNSNRKLREGLSKLGYMPYVAKDHQSPIITTFTFPNGEFEFGKFYLYVKERGYVIYPGKLTDVDTFRVGNIGEIYEEDIDELCRIIGEYTEGR